ncbi:uncharacterized protein LOC124171794 [Ischnura elegans]|uniref:uncharacterized protein LOC124171794 n=1 Tax=Ischnura elegans TaxID=197161 RepID=UPI001ED8B64F|nr:uncharacterized protein LOC124171794 [Ischnura elegans]
MKLVIAFIAISLIVVPDWDRLIPSEKEETEFSPVNGIPTSVSAPEEVGVGSQNEVSSANGFLELIGVKKTQHASRDQEVPVWVDEEEGTEAFSDAQYEWDLKYEQQLMEAGRGNSGEMDTESKDEREDTRRGNNTRHVTKFSFGELVPTILYVCLTLCLTLVFVWIMRAAITFF